MIWSSEKSFQQHQAPAWLLTAGLSPKKITSAKLLLNTIKYHELYGLMNIRSSQIRLWCSLRLGLGHFAPILSRWHGSSQWHRNVNGCEWFQAKKFRMGYITKWGKCGQTNCKSGHPASTDSNMTKAGGNLVWNLNTKHIKCIAKSHKTTFSRCSAIVCHQVHQQMSPINLMGLVTCAFVRCKDEVPTFAAAHAKLGCPVVFKSRSKTRLCRSTWSTWKASP